MVLPGQDLRKPSFSREKDGFSRVRSLQNHLFLQKKMVFRRAAAQKPSFSREKDGFEPKKPSFSRENQKKPSLEGTSPIVLEKMVFLFFFCFLEKKMVFWFETIFFSRKKIVLSNHPSKNHLFLEKKMVLPGEDLQKPSFSREKDGFTRTRPPETIFFSRKRWFFQGPAP